MGLSALVWAPFLLNVVDSDAGWIYPQWNTERTWALSVGVMLIAASAVVMVRAGRAHVRVGGGAVTVSNPFRTRVYDCADVQIINWSSVESGAAGTAAVGTGPFSPDAAGLGQTAPVVPGVALLVPGRRRPLRIVAFGSMSRTNEQVVRFAQALEGSKHRSRNE